MAPAEAGGLWGAGIFAGLGGLAVDWVYWKEQAILGQEQQRLDNADAIANYQARQWKKSLHKRGPQTPKPGGVAHVGGNCPQSNAGRGGKKPPGGKAVAAPGGDGGNPFKYGGPFKTFEDAVGLPPGSLDGAENIGPATDARMNEYGFTQKWIGQDWSTGDWYSAYYNPDTGEWAGGKGSSHE